MSLMIVFRWAFAALGPDLVLLSANVRRNLIEERFGILTAVFEAASINT